MKQIRFLATASILVACFLFSCNKGPELYLSTRFVEFEAMSEDSIIVRISSTVKWQVTLLQDWVIVDPMEGENNGNIIITAEYNPDFFRRTAKIAISGDGVKTDTIFVEQIDGIDIAPFIINDRLRDTCLFRYDVSPKDGKLSISELNKVQELTIRRMELNTLRGIEYFTRLTYLDCSENNLTTIDLSNNKLLRELNCSSNRLERLDMTRNKELLRLNCGFMESLPNRKFTQLNVTGLEKLRVIETYNTDLSSIDVSTNIALETLAISRNPISSLTLTNNLNLVHLECNDNLFTEINISSNTKLATLSLYRSDIRDGNGNIITTNKLRTLTLTANTELINLDISGNLLSDPNIVKNNTKLRSLICSRNSFTSLDLSANVELAELICNMNQLTSLNLSYNPKLERLSCESCSLSGSLNLRHNPNLRYIYLRYNNLNQILVWNGFCTQVRHNEWYPDYIPPPGSSRLPFEKDFSTSWVQENGNICDPPP